MSIVARLRVEVIRGRVVLFGGGAPSIVGRLVCCPCCGQPVAFRGA